MVCILATNVTHICQFTKARGVVSTLTYIAWKAEGTHNSGDCHEKKPLMSVKSGNFNLTLGKLIERNKKLGKFEEFDHRKEEAFTVTLMAKILSLIIEKLSTF